MNYSGIKDEYEIKRNHLKEELNSYIERAINFDEMFDVYETKENIDLSELEWNDAKDKHYYENLQQIIWLFERVIEVVNIMMDIDSDKKKEHNANKEIEELISSTRKLKKERMEFVEQEQKQLSEMKSVLDILDEIREK